MPTLSGNAIVLIFLAVPVLALVLEARFRRNHVPLTRRVGKTSARSRPELGMEATDLHSVRPVEHQNNLLNRRNGYGNRASTMAEGNLPAAELK